MERRGCPFCGGPAVNVAGEYITCGAAWNPDCEGHQVRVPPKAAQWTFWPVWAKAA